MAEVPGLESDEYLAENIDKFGGPEAYNHYAIGWAHAMGTPYQWTKQVASHWGGTRNGTIVHWPAGIAAKGELRHQFCYVTDIAPTVLELAGLPEPTTVNGITQEPMHGVSMSYSFDDPDAPERHSTQYFEVVCNRGIYHQGWSAVTRHHLPWEQHVAGRPVRRRRVGALRRHHRLDPSPRPRRRAPRQARRAATAVPARSRPSTRCSRSMTGWRDASTPNIAGRPQLVQGGSVVLFPGMRSLTENAMPSLKNKSYSITAEVVIPDGGANGVILNQGGITGGWALYLHDGRPTYHYSFLGLDRATVAAPEPLAPGDHQVRVEFAYDGDGLGKGGTATIYIDGTRPASGRVERTHAFVFSLDETTDVGIDTGSPVSPDYPAGDNAFTGTINWVRVDTGDDSHDHLIDPAQLMRFAISRQ